MGSHIDKLASKVHVIFEIVLALAGVSDITGVTHGTLNKTAGLSCSVYTQLQVLEVVQRVEYTEDINSRFLSLVAEFVDNIVGVVGVTNSVGTTQQHLERNIRRLFSKRFQTLPRTLVQKSHGNIKGGSTPHFQRKGITHNFIGSCCTSFQFLCSHTSCEQRLVSITPGGIHDHKTLVVTDSLGHAFGTFVQQNLSQISLLNRRRGN
mmetsp:Transcript_14353/g.29703  ORF Transcript_14353/g.29703 Transcript_14353/m.29703 type:complete len:207 (-) Transcript_14353:394-1014(-)